MSPRPPSAFDLQPHAAWKSDPDLIGSDDQQFTLIAGSLSSLIDELADRRAAELAASGGKGQAALERDVRIRRLDQRLRALHRFSLDLSLGRIVLAEDEPLYIGRIGLTDARGRRLLIDWRSPAAAPFFAATYANPMGLVSRRRYHWTRGRVSDYWDELFTAANSGQHLALDDESALIASLDRSRSAQMRDVLTTIQTDQDAIIRAGSRGALVVDGGPGTGKTVVALHRTAYLLYADPRLRNRHRGVLFIGPHEPYLAYVADVLPSLGEEGAQTCTLRELVPEGAGAAEEPDPRVAALKASTRLLEAIEPAVRFYEDPPEERMTLTAPWADLSISAKDWAAAFDAVEVGTPHNEGRAEVFEALLAILVEKCDDDVPADELRSWLSRDREVGGALRRAWPLIEPADLVGDLWSVPAYLRRCAPWLAADQVALLQRPHPHGWTVSDLPFLDAARQRLGDSNSVGRRRRSDALIGEERARMDQVVDDLMAADDDGEGVVTMLRGEDLRTSLIDEAAVASDEVDPLAGPFAHVVVDEAQELTDAEWQMLLRRCPSRSFTIVGDRAQARHGFTEPWPSRLERVGFTEVRIASLSINYRTPAEIMAEAEPEIRSALPDANVPVSIRVTGAPVLHRPASDRDSIIDDWLSSHPDGIGCVIGDPSFRSRDRVRALSPELAKGLEFDLVLLVDPAGLGGGIEGAVDRYVSMTRATQQLVILTTG